MTDKELLWGAKVLRIRASEVGSMSALWDVIFEAEAHAYGQVTQFPRAQVEDMVIAATHKALEEAK